MQKRNFIFVARVYSLKLFFIQAFLKRYYQRTSNFLKIPATKKREKATEMECLIT